MKNILCRITAIVLLMTAAQRTHAQMPYVVSTLNEPYVPLSNAVSVNNGQAWSDTSTFTIPVGFNFNLDGRTLNTVTLTQTSLLLAAATGTQSGFAFLGTSLQDRNYPGVTSVSPIRYTVSGNTGARIFKLEISNAGFSNEREVFDSQNDSIQVQVWIYEQNSAVEFRFGTSVITHFDDYFDTKIPLGFMKNLNMETFAFTRFYTLKGNPASPGMDSVSSLNTPAGIDAYPAAGTVYRFLPKGSPTAIRSINRADLGRIYPVPATNILYIESSADRYALITPAGQILQQGNLAGSITQLSLAGMTPGMYFMRLSNLKNETALYKFIKQ